MGYRTHGGHGAYAFAVAPQMQALTRPTSSVSCDPLSELLGRVKIRMSWSRWISCAPVALGPSNQSATTSIAPSVCCKKRGQRGMLYMQCNYTT